MTRYSAARGGGRAKQLAYVCMYIIKISSQESSAETASQALASNAEGERGVQQAGQVFECLRREGEYMYDGEHDGKPTVG